MLENTISNAMTMRIGTCAALGRIDQYEILQELGGGGFGTVYLAKDTVSGIDVAVKGLPPFVKNNREEMENIRANFALVSRLHHPNIAAALVLHLAQNAAYSSEDVRQKLRVLSGDTLMVMEYAPGVTLSQWRKQFPERKVPLDKALEITRQIAAALDYAHERKIVHRDIKPANVMIETVDDDTVVSRVLDFGLAAEIRSSMGRVSREIHDTSGTRPYMAPEQWLGDRQGPATDQYALAVLFNELVTGDVPFSSVFDTGDPVVMMNAIGSRPFVPSQELPKPMRLALSRALAKKPEERFASCSEFVAALEGRKVAGRKSPSKIGGGAAKRRGSMAAGAIAAAVFAAIAVGGYYGWVKYDESVKVREAEKAAEMARVRQEVYELKGKASQAREKNEKEEWHAWPHFGDKAKELEGAFRAGEAALAKDDFEVARLHFLKVRDSWYWMNSNKVERTKAIAAKEMAEKFRRNAETANSEVLSSNVFAAATEGFVAATVAFDAGSFHVSETEFLKAVKAFEAATSKAKAESARLVAERKKADTEAALAAFRASPPQYEEGLRLFQTADQENAELQYFIGKCHLEGIGTETNVQLAAKWLDRSASQGFPAGLSLLGACYMEGLGVERNQAKAVKLFDEASSKGDVRAKRNLGLCYIDGIGVDEDAAVGSRLLREAADKGDTKAQARFALLLLEGRGVDKDEKEGVRLLSLAADKGLSLAQGALGGCYMMGMGVEKDERKAFQLFKASAENGNARSQGALACCYQNGNGVDKDDAKAFYWFQRAAEQGDADAQYSLGVCYVAGLGVTENCALAEKWFLKASDQGVAGAQYSLGALYEKSDLAKAKKYYKMAADGGDERARQDLRKLQVKKTIDDFFPVSGVTLGRTRHSEIVSMGGKATGEYAKQCVRYVDIAWWDHNEDGVVEQIYMTRYEKLPQEWVQEGMSVEMSYDEWMAFFQKRGFTIKVTKSPTTTPHFSDKNNMTLEAAFKATASDGSVEFKLEFNYGNNKGEGYSTSSRNSLYSISVSALK